MPTNQPTAREQLAQIILFGEIAAKEQIVQTAWGATPKRIKDDVLDKADTILDLIPQLAPELGLVKIEPWEANHIVNALKKHYVNEDEECCFVTSALAKLQPIADKAEPLKMEIAEEGK